MRNENGIYTFVDASRTGMIVPSMCVSVSGCEIDPNTGLWFLQLILLRPLDN